MIKITLHFFNVFFICSIVQLCLASPIQDLPTSMKQKKCRVNICFAIDGSGSISKSTYRHQLGFVLDTVDILSTYFSDRYLAFAAAQYGSIAYQISPLTPDAKYFRLATNKVKSIRSGRTDIVAGLRYCTNQLSSDPADIKVTMLIGDGRSNGSEDPVQVAESFRKSGGTIISVGVGNANIGVLQKISGSDEKVYSLNSFVEVALELESLITDNCRP